MSILFFFQAAWAEPAAYRLSVGDKIAIEVFDEKELSIETVIDSLGNITFPLLGELSILNKTPREIEIIVSDGLRGRYLVSPRVTATVTGYRQFFVNGEVNKPGGYAYIPDLTLRKAIALAGGLTQRASSDRVFIVKDSDSKKTPIRVGMDHIVLPGDIIKVHEYRQVFVSGEVKKPGNYEFQPELTLRKLIALAGGFTARASEKKVFLIRENDGQKNESQAELDAEIRPGDIVTVGERFF